MSEKTMQVNGMKVSLNGSKLKIECLLDSNPPLSNSGKSYTLASSEGFRALDELDAGLGFNLSVNRLIRRR